MACASRAQELPDWKAVQPHMKEELVKTHVSENKALCETLAAVNVKRERAEATAEHYKERSDDLSAQNKDLFARLLNWN